MVEIKGEKWSVFAVWDWFLMRANVL